MEPLKDDVSIIWLETADSTNKELRRRLEGLDNLSVVAAREQTAGRGQGAHTWFSRPGSGLTFSLLLRFPGSSAIRATELLLITELTTLALRDYLLSREIEARIKWPNDIWVGERKICGILIENILDGEFIRESIVGIGLNVNETCWPEELPNPVSMKQLTGRNYSLRDELEALCAHIAVRYALLASPDGRRRLDEEFNKYMFTLSAPL